MPAIEHLNLGTAPGALERHGAANYSRADDDDSHITILYAGDPGLDVRRPSAEADQNLKFTPVSNRRGCEAEVAWP